jgi:hypothetical protein
MEMHPSHHDLLMDRTIAMNPPNTVTVEGTPPLRIYQLADTVHIHRRNRVIQL